MTRSDAKKDRGAAAVEFALVALLFITLVVGGIEFGRLWMMQSSLSQAARDAARELAIKKDEADIQGRVDAVYLFGSASASSTATCPDAGDPATVYSASVAATHDTTFMTGLIGSGTITLRGEGTMRCGG